MAESREVPWLQAEWKNGSAARSFAADAHDCIMVRVLGPTEYKVVARLIRARKRAPPPIVIPTAPSGAVVLEAVKVWPRKSEAYRKVGAPANLDSPLRATVLALLRVGTKKRAFRSNKETDKGRHALHCRTS